MGNPMVGGLCFVYGSLRHGLGNHHVVEGAIRQEDGKIPKGEFRMRSLGGFPALHPVDPELSTDIVVEVYEVEDLQRARRLDGLEGYPSFYDRKIVTLEDGRQGWVYFIHQESRVNSLVEHGDWKRYVEERGSRW